MIKTRIRAAFIMLSAILAAVAMVIVPTASAAMNGYDVSGWQSANITRVADGDFAIVKVSQGTWTTGTWRTQAAVAVATGKSLGLYHYAAGGNAVAEANHFVNEIGSYVGSAVLALDWESIQNAAWGNGAWITSFVTQVHARTHVWPIIYVQKSAVWQVPAWVRARCMLWAASYGSMAATGYQSQPWGLGSAGEGMLQYSSNGWLNGHGPLDLDIFLGDRNAWYKIAMGERAGAVAPAPATNPSSGSSSSSSSSKPKTTTTTTTTTSSVYYTVRSGDNLSAIGARMGIVWTSIASMNGLRAPYLIYPGQRLVVKYITSEPNPKTTTTTSRTYYTVRAGDTLSGIGSRTGIAWTSIASMNGLRAPYLIYPGQRLVVKYTASASVSASTGTRYTVRRGDTLSGIGSRTGVAWRTIASINGIHIPWIIYPGQSLRLR